MANTSRHNIGQVIGPEKWLILGVSLTHLVELFFLEAEIVDNIFQWDVLKNMRQIKSYDDMFQAIRALTVQKILKIRILSQKFFENESFFSFSVKCFDIKGIIPRKDTTIHIAWYHSYNSKHFLEYVRNVAKKQHDSGHDKLR